jgi:hypothetical protein
VPRRNTTCPPSQADLATNLDDERVGEFVEAISAAP